MSGRSVKPFIYRLKATPLIWLALIAAPTTMTASTHQQGKKIALLVEELKLQLHISNWVQVGIVENNRLGLSVVPADSRCDFFILLIDTHLLHRLDSDQLKAALAHELGHVWIYTHHPYLQTEALANQVAMRAVSREAL